jgi:cytochrome oxidase Cu insertion factor (SCO1/SenC/PrrC family)
LFSTIVRLQQDVSLMVFCFARCPGAFLKILLALNFVVIASSGCRQKPSPAIKTSNSTSEATPADASAESSNTEFVAPRILYDAPKFRLTDQTGTAFGSAELQGEVWIGNFMFTKCRATCPRQTEKFAELQQRLGRWPEHDRIRLISFSVDPENDTIEKLRDYAQSHGADPVRWKFLTGPRADLWTMSKDGFKLSVADSATDTSSPITHSPMFVLVDAQGKVRGYYDGLNEEGFAKLLKDTRAILSTPTSNAQETIHIPQPPDLFDPVWLETPKSEQLAGRDKLQVLHDFKFHDACEASGIQFVSRAVADASRDFKRNHYDHANGVVVGDVDGDGLHDLYFVNQVGGNELWRNVGGGRFENITETAGVAVKGRVCVSASFADTDNDGDPDLFVTTTRHGNVFFENQGQGRFVDTTAKAGLDYTGHSSTGEFFDYDRDGRLDLLVTNVGSFTTEQVGQTVIGDLRAPYFIGRDDSFVGHMFRERYESSLLYHNDGDNHFTNVTRSVGIEPIWTGDATPLDVNDDGWPDLYFANMQGEDAYYANIEGKRFELRQHSAFPVAIWGGMCVKSFDYNNDGKMDLYITNMHADMWAPRQLIIGSDEKRKAPRDKFPDSYLAVPNGTNLILGNGFYEKTGPNQFREISEQNNTETYWPWGHSVGDLNADGFQDIFVATSMNYPYRYTPNLLLLNDRGQKFVEAEYITGIEPRAGGRVATPWFELNGSGPDSKHALAREHKGRVVVWGALGSRSSVLFDLDQDGDLDIVTNDFNSPPQVLISNLSERNPALKFVKIQLRGTKSNRDGLGAKVQVTAGEKSLTQVHDGQSGYLSQSSYPLYFGLGSAATIDKIVVEWPSGTRQELTGPIETNQQLVITEEQ